jgi:predicted ATPase/class 3 adenylate cyclase
MGDCPVVGPVPTGTVTFLFTDIEGSTRLWEADADAMRAALVAHDAVLRDCVEVRGGWLFKHTGDGVCAVFASARAAVDAAVAGQRRLGLPVRMGIATGEADCRGDDYFGPVLNRTARVTAAGHGGQILVAASTAGVVSGVDLVDRGEHRLRDLSGVEHLYQVRAEGLRAEFPPLRTLDAVPGNLPVQTTSFVGREVAVKELCELVRAHRMVTMTGVGGVGKTRLALHVAAELVSEFPDGVWLIELASVRDPAALPDVMATALGVTPQAGLSMTASLIQALSGRRLLVVLDNCEHLLDAAADLVEELLAHTTAVRLITTSREVLRVGAEQVWSVPSLEFREGVESAAVGLFVERAAAVNPTFGLNDDAEAQAAIELCQRLDGIPLAIELAAARMVAMSAQDVRDHLGDRFRLLSGARRGLERHQTLRQAVQWSYDLLGDDERVVLHHCSVFAGGFDLAAATHVCGGDEYGVLDALASLARKSLITVERVGGHARYAMLETIRQFAEEQLAATDTIEQIRDRHARFYADQAVAYWEVWEGPGYRTATDWVAVEFANLRAAFRWAADNGDVVTASAVAAHATTMGFFLLLFEPMGWVDEIFPTAIAADVAQLPRLYAAAALWSYIGRTEAALAHAQTGLGLEADPRYDPFDPGFSRTWANVAYSLAGGDLDHSIEVYAELARQPGLAGVINPGLVMYLLPAVGRAEEAAALAPHAQRVARAHGNPVYIAGALLVTGRALVHIDPVRALDAFRQALTVAQEQRIPWYEARAAWEAANLETTHGDVDRGLELFDTAVDAYHRAGNLADLSSVLAELAVFLDRDGQAETAATIYGRSSHYPNENWVIGLPAAVEHLRAELGDIVFDQCVAAGAAMDIGDAVRSARDQIQVARRRHADDD